jgi:hypothetical protein
MTPTMLQLDRCAGRDMHPPCPNYASKGMSKDPWTSDDPQPGDFDALLETIGAAFVERRDGDAGATLSMLVSVEGEDATPA